MAQLREYKEIYKYERTKMLTGHKRKTREPSRESGRTGSQTVYRDPPYSCAFLIDNRENPQAPSSIIWTWEFRGVRNSLTSGVVNAKWRAGTSTRVSLNSNKKSMYWKSCREHMHTGAGRDSKWYQVGNMHGIIWSKQETGEIKHKW